MAFPDRRYPDMAAFWDGYAADMARAMASVSRAALNRAAAILGDAVQAHRTIFACGNGGSAAIANHLMCDHLKSVRTDTRLMPRVVSLANSIETITAVANDIGYADVFLYQLQSLAVPGDVLIAISSSGNSPNIVETLRWANERELRTIAMTGFAGGEAAKLAQVSLHVDAANYGIAEDVHQGLMHALAQYLRLSHLVGKEPAEVRF